MTREEMKNEIESLIDSACADTVRELFGEVCREKADHVRTNWQDESTARVWDAYAAKLDSVPNMGV